MVSTLELVELDSALPGRLEAEAARLADAIGPLAAANEHVWSTAVPSLPFPPTLTVP